MNLLRVLLACLLIAVAPLRGHAGTDCCPAMGHATHAHGTHTGHGPDGPDPGLARLACALHCASATLPTPSVVAVATLPAAYRSTPPPAHPPLANASPHDRPPKPCMV